MNDPVLPFLHTDKSGSVLIDIHVVPNAKVTQSDGLHDGALRVRLHAPPVDGKANEALLAWLADRLEVPRRSLSMLRGLSARRKQVSVTQSAAASAKWDTLVAPKV